MDGEGSCWIGRMTAGERAAQQQLWQRYFERRVRLAQARLRAAPPQGEVIGSRAKRSPPCARAIPALAAGVEWQRCERKRWRAR
jgi:hypothetical protein